MQVREAKGWGAAAFAVVVAVACEVQEPAPGVAPSASATAQPTASCPAGTKSCASACVPVAAPETGCAGASCAPCAPAHASSACGAEGQCVVSACENGFGDCNGAPADGCEVDLGASDAHCGACGAACGADQTCRAATCVSRSVVETEAWLSTQTSGYCLDGYNKIMNLCGDVEFCFDARVMRPYPEGISVDFGFVWDGKAPDRALLAMGGDCDGKAIGIAAGQVVGFGTHTQFPKLAVGKHVLGFRIAPTGGAVYVDGLRIASVPPPPKPIELLGACGPGLVVGSRISYWWEANQEPNHQNMAVFLVHVRAGVTDEPRYDVAKATSPQPSTVFLYDGSGVSGSTWTARAGGLVGVGKNAKDGTPQIDGGASGPLPEWKPLAACTL